MKPNVGCIDRMTRTLAGLAILGAGYYFQSWFGLIGLIPLLTAALGWCPAYVPLGLSTCKVKSSPT